MAKATYTSYLGTILKGAEDQARVALEVIGSKAETYASKLAPVDTSLLKNSITHGVSGGSLSFVAYKADRGDGTGEYPTDKVPSSIDGSRLFTIVGTNVHYAPYLELGAKGRSPRPYIKPSIENHMEEYKRILKHYISH